MMAQSNGKKLSFIGGLILAGTVTIAMGSVVHVPVASAAIGSVPAMFFDLITTSVHSPALPSDPDGTCSVCIASTDGESSGAQAEIEIYYEDDGQDFTGDFELLLTLNNSQQRNAEISDVTMYDQTTDQFYVSAGSDWDWNDVASVRVEAVPAP